MTGEENGWIKDDSIILFFAGDKVMVVFDRKKGY